MNVLRHDVRIRIGMRTFFFWLMLRVGIALLSGTVSDFSTRTTIVVAAVVAVLSIAELRLRHERIFLANLGVSQQFVVASAMSVVFLSEIACRLIAAGFSG